MVLEMPLSRQEIERVAHARGKSLREFAKAAKIDKMSLLKYIDGETRPRDESVWVRIDEVYNEWLRELSDPRFAISPVFARLSFLAPRGPGEWKTDIYNDFLDVPFFLAKNNRVAIRVDDERFAPELLRGEILVFEMDPSPRSGRKSIASRHGDNIVSIGSIQRDRTLGGTTFVPLADPDSASPLWTPVGYLVAILRDWQLVRGIIEFDDGGLA
jgi:hypothetical protein